MEDETKANGTQIRQGDLLFEVGKGLPQDVVKVGSTYVLANGEVTGHMHRVNGKVVMIQQAITNTGLVKEITTDDESVSVVHEEHVAIKLPKNTVITVTRQRQYSPHGNSGVLD